jgi:hypothetical protein
MSRPKLPPKSRQYRIPFSDEEKEYILLKMSERWSWGNIARALNVLPRFCQYNKKTRSKNGVRLWALYGKDIHKN